MKTVGQILRAAREGRKLELPRAAQDLRISTRYLAAIESDEVDKLPGAFFYRSFVRQYADYLELSDAQDRRVIDNALSTTEATAPPSLEVRKTPIEVPRMTSVEGQRVPTTDYRRWGLGLASFIAVVAMCALIYAGWQRYITHQTEVASTATPAASSTPPPAKPQSAPAQNREETKAPTPRQDDLTAQQASNASYTSDETDAFAPIRLTVRAIEATWIRVTGDGKTLFVGLLEPSSQRSFTGSSQARLLVGNAGGLEVKWNGQELGAIGPRGQVRVVEFTPENYQIMQLPPKQAALNFNPDDSADGVD